MVAAAHGLHAEPPPPPSLDPNHLRERVPLGSMVLPDPSTAAPTHWNGAAAVQTAAGRPLHVELPPPPSHSSNQPRERLHLTPTELPSPAKPPPPRRSATAVVQGRRRPPAPADRPPQATSAPTETTGRCARAPSPFSPTFPSPPGPNLVGNGAVGPPCSVPSAKDLP
jgi:hypothetical protein